MAKATNKARELRIVKPDAASAPDADVAHLSAETLEWVTQVEAEYDLGGHHRRLLIAAAEAWERSVEAREALTKHGLTYVDRFRQPKERPEVAIASRAANDFRLLTRELGLDLPAPDGHRPPRIGGGA